MQDYIDRYFSIGSDIVRLQQEKAKIEAELKNLQIIQGSLVSHYLEPFYLDVLKGEQGATFEVPQGIVSFKTRRSSTLLVPDEKALVSELTALNHPEFIKTVMKRTADKAALKKEVALISSLSNAEIENKSNLKLHLKSIA